MWWGVRSVVHGGKEVACRLVSSDVETIRAAVRKLSVDQQILVILMNIWGGCQDKYIKTEFAVFKTHNAVQDKLPLKVSI